jgi:hypothetical protein
LTAQRYFGRGGGCRRTNIGHEIGNRKIRLVANGRNDRYAGSKYGSGNLFVVKCTKVFDGSAAASQNNEIGLVPM